MEKENITLDPRSSFTPSSSADIPVPPDGLVQRSTRIKRIQTTAMLLLFFAAVINYLDRSSLSVANLTIREELGLSATEIGALLSVFSLAYGIGQLPDAGTGDVLLVTVPGNVWHGAQLYAVRVGAYRYGDW